MKKRNLDFFFNYTSSYRDICLISLSWTQLLGFVSHVPLSYMFLYIEIKPLGCVSHYFSFSMSLYHTCFSILNLTGRVWLMTTFKHSIKKLPPCPVQFSTIALVIWICVSFSLVARGVESFQMLRISHTWLCLEGWNLQ